MLQGEMIREAQAEKAARALRAGVSAQQVAELYGRLALAHALADLEAGE